VRVIYSGVDTLEASFRGQLHEVIRDWCDEHKVLAQDRDCPEPFLGFDEPFVLSPSGLKPWKWVLAGEDMHLRLTDRENLPTVSVRLLALGLAAQGWEGLYELAWSILSQLGHLTPAGLSRIDLFADFQGLTPTPDLMEGIVCRATYSGTHSKSRTTQTFQYGKGAIVCRIYNKSAELEVSGKRWLREAWALCEDFDPEQDVWRIEYQLRRQFLKETGDVEAHAVFERLAELWVTCLGWCELRIPNGKNQSRWPLHPAWRELAALSPEASPLRRLKVVGYVENFEAVIPQIAGLLISACSSVGMTSLDSALENMSDRIREYIDDSGQPFRDQVRKRIRKRLAAK
jgi:hypothetical protein